MVPARSNSLSTTSSPFALRRYFIGENGIYPIWRLLIFAALVWFLDERFVRQMVRFVVLNLLPRGSMRMNEAHEVGPWVDILEAGIRFIALLIASWGMSRIERRPMRDYGLPLRSISARQFSVGSLMGLAGVTVVLSAMYFLHGFEFGTLATAGVEALKSGALWTVACLAVAFHEEYRFRGFALVTLSESVRFWIAGVLISAWFAVAHMGNDGESVTGLLSVFVFGLLFCFMVRRTGSLWLAVGFHFGWNLAQTFIFGVPDSGVLSKGRLLTPVFHGPAWLTGGTVGPEGSALCFMTIGLMAAITHWAYPAVEVTANLNSRKAAA